jgi:hypothetical protein
MAGPGKPSFGLQKTWRASGTGTQTFNSSGNYPIPYGRYQITVAGRGGTGTAAVPGNPNYNPYVPGNPIYNPVIPGNPNYNPYYPGNPNYNPYYPGNANYNPYYPGNFNYNPQYYVEGFYSYFYDDYVPGYFVPGNITGSNPGSGGNYAGANPGSGGNYAGANPGSGGNPSGSNPSSGGNYAGANPASGGNFAGNNPTTPAVPGSPATALGVTMPGSNSGGTPAPVTPATLVSYYSYPDNTTYPVSVPSGGYVTITSS